MKKLLLSSILLTINISIYGLSLEQTLNQFSASLTALAAAFKGSVIITPPPAKTELEQLENQSLIKIEQYRDDIKNGIPFENAQNFIDQSENYFKKGGTSNTILMWHDLLLADILLLTYSHESIANILKDNKNKFNNAQELFDELTTLLAKLKSYNIQSESGPVKEFYQDVVVDNLEAWIENLEQEEQLLAMIKGYIKNLQNKTPFENSNTFIDKGKIYTKIKGTNQTIKLWTALLVGNKNIQDLTAKAASGPITNVKQNIASLNNNINWLKTYPNVAQKEPNTKEFYNTILGSLQEWVTKLETQLSAEQLYAQTKQFETSLLEKKPLDPTIEEKFITDSDNLLRKAGGPAISASKELSTIQFYNYTLKLQNLITTNKDLSVAALMQENPDFKSIADIISSINGHLQDLENYKEKFFTEKKYGTQTSWEFINSIETELKEWISKLELENATQKTQDEITQLESKIKTFIINNFSKPLVENGTENLSQWKEFQDDYKKLAAKTDKIDDLIKFWYLRTYLKVKFENNNLLQTTFDTKGDTKMSSIEATLKSFDDLAKKYDQTSPFIIGSPDNGKLSQENVVKFSNKLPDIKNNLMKQKELIDYITGNFANDVTTFGKLKSNINESKAENYKKLYQAYITIESNPNVLKPYSYWYYRSLLLLGNVNQIAGLFGKTEGFARTNLIPELYTQYKNIKPNLSGLGVAIPEKELLAIYLLTNKAQAQTGDNLIATFIQKEIGK